MSTVPVPSPPVNPRRVSSIVTTTPSHVAPLYADTNVPVVSVIQAQQAASTWRTIPWNSPTSWNGWRQTPDGLEYMPAVTSSGPAKWARHEWAWLPNRHKDDFYLIGAAAYNTIQVQSTFATPAVMRGFLRAVKATTGVRL